MLRRLAVAVALCALASPSHSTPTVSQHTVCWQGQESWSLCARSFASVAFRTLPTVPLRQGKVATVSFALTINTTALVWCDGEDSAVFTPSVVTCEAGWALCSVHSPHATRHGTGTVRASSFDRDAPGEAEVLFDAHLEVQEVGEVSLVGNVHFLTCEGATATNHNIMLTAHGVEVAKQDSPETVGTSVLVIVLCVATTVAASLVLLLVLVVRHRNTEAFREVDSDVWFDVPMLVLSLVDVSSLYASQNLTDWKCQALPFWRGIPMVCTVAFFLGRCYEVWWGIKHPEFKGALWTVRLWSTVPWVLPMVVLCLVEAVVAPPRTEDTTRSWGISRVCGGEFWALHTAREVYLVVLLAFALWLLARFATMRQREIGRLQFVVANVAILLWFNLIPLFVTENPSQRFFRTSATTLSVVCIIAYSLMVPKVVAVVRPVAKRRTLRKNPQSQFGPLSPKRTPSQSVLNTTERVTKLVNGSVPPDLQESLRRTWELMEVMTGLIVACMPVPRTIMEESVKRVKELHGHLRTCRFIKKRITLQAIKPKANSAAIVLVPRLGKKAASSKDKPAPPHTPFESGPSSRKEGV